MGYKAIKFVAQEGREKWVPIQRNSLINNDDLEILNKYNSEIRGLYNYYSIANNSSDMVAFKYGMEYSMYKTFASKYNTTMCKIISKYKRNKIFTINYTTKKGPRSAVFYNKGFKRKTENIGGNTDIIPTTRYTRVQQV